MPSAWQTGLLFSYCPQNVMESGVWLRGGKDRCLLQRAPAHRIYLSYCPDLKKKQIIPVHHLKHHEYLKLPIDDVICQEPTENMNLDPLTCVHKNENFSIFL